MEKERETLKCYRACTLQKNHEYGNLILIHASIDVFKFTSVAMVINNLKSISVMDLAAGYTIIVGTRILSKSLDVPLC